MKSVTKKVLITVSVIAFLIFGAIATMAIRFSIDMKRFKTLETAQLSPSVLTINSEISNVFLIPNGDGTYLSIDAGSADKFISRGLIKLKIDPDKITTTLCTHSDNDHVDGVKAFPKSQIVISVDEEQMVNGKTARALGFVRNSLARDYKTIATGQETMIGSHKITGILTPGHTPGSTCWLVDDSLLFTGDAVGFSNGKAGLFSNLFNMNSKQQVNSIRNIASLPSVKHIYTAHQGHYNYSEDLFR